MKHLTRLAKQKLGIYFDVIAFFVLLTVYNNCAELKVPEQLQQKTTSIADQSHKAEGKDQKTTTDVSKNKESEEQKKVPSAFQELPASRFMNF